MFSMNKYDFVNNDLAAMLEEDSSGRVLAALLDSLNDGRRKLKNALDKGVTPDEFAIGEKVLDSYDAAVQGVETLRR